MQMPMQMPIKYVVNSLTLCTLLFALYSLHFTLCTLYTTQHKEKIKNKIF